MKATPGPRFWHRTRRRPSFWLGLFVVCFLAWAWWDSYRQNPTVSYGWRGEAVEIIRLHGSTYFAVGPDWSWSRGASLTFKRIRKEKQARIWESVGWRYIEVPDPRVFFSFLGLWIGWLALSDWRRKKRGREA
jgi:hypothetical protein